jgi:hypothetical protein
VRAPKGKHPNNLAGQTHNPISNAKTPRRQSGMRLPVPVILKMAGQTHNPISNAKTPRRQSGMRLPVPVILKRPLPPRRQSGMRLPVPVILKGNIHPNDTLAAHLSGRE